jgi:hypothetical protein
VDCMDKHGDDAREFGEEKGTDALREWLAK